MTGANQINEKQKSGGSVSEHNQGLVHEQDEWLSLSR